MTGRRSILKALAGAGAALGLGTGASTANETESQRNEQAEQPNPARVAEYAGNTTLVPPDLAGFDHVLVYFAEGRPDDDWDGVAQAEHFQREIMDRSTEEIMAARRAAEEFHADRFGVEVEPFDGDDELFDVKETPDGKARLEPAYQNPAVGYTAYLVSGRGMPNVTGDGTTNVDESRTGKVRDGGWHVRITEPMTLHGEYGGSEGVEVEAPTTLAYGHYNIKMGDLESPIVIRFESEHPITPHERIPTAFNCDLFHEEWGEGQVHGTLGLPSGGLRNVLTFPPTPSG
jgi:hypothetical protein